MAGPLDRFDDSAKRVLALAQSQAVRLGHGQIGPEHLLLGLLREGDGAAQILTSSGVDGYRLYQTVAQMQRSQRPDTERTDIPLSPQSKRVIVIAREEADKLGDRSIAPEHLLLGVALEPGDASAVLRDIGGSLDAEAIRETVMGRERGD